VFRSDRLALSRFHPLVFPKHKRELTFPFFPSPFQPLLAELATVSLVGLRFVPGPGRSTGHPPVNRHPVLFPLRRACLQSCPSSPFFSVCRIGEGDALREHKCRYISSRNGIFSPTKAPAACPSEVEGTSPFQVAKRPFREGITPPLRVALIAASSPPPRTRQPFLWKRIQDTSF